MAPKAGTYIVRILPLFFVAGEGKLAFVTCKCVAHDLNFGQNLWQNRGK